jgi:microcin C transport system permease protein
MGAYFARRFLLMIPTFLGITFMVFLITRFVPGGPIEQMILQIEMGGGGKGSEGGAGAASSQQTGQGSKIPPEVMAELNKKFGFDKPAPVAYGAWLWDVVRGDLGKSYKYDKPVIELVTERFPVSIYFGLIGFTLAYLVCIPLGALKAIKHGSTFDLASSAVVFVGYSIPGWALGTMLLVYFGGGSFWDVIPLGGFRSPGWEQMGAIEKVKDQLSHTVAPVICYAIGSFATLTVLMKNGLMENLGQDYVRSAFAKGLPEKRVIFGHALRNSLIPVCTGLGHALGIVMAGSYLIEYTFNINGLGFLGYNSVVERDYAVVMGVLVINTALVLFGNIMSDVLYVLVDPRIRFS